MSKETQLSIIIVNYNSGKYLYNTIRSVYDSYPDTVFEIIVVDNKSSDSSLSAVIRNFPEVHIIELDNNEGFSKANNIGAKIAVGEYLLFLNNDTEIFKSSIDTLLNEIKENPIYGIVSPVLLYEDGSTQLNYGNDPNIISEFVTKYFLQIIFRLNTKLMAGNIEKNVDWISGACFIITSELYKKLNGFDENFFLYYEDTDLGKRVRAEGFKNHVTSKSKIIHFLGKSTTTVYNEILPKIKKGHLYYYQKHNHSYSLNFLKLYLLMKFRIKRVFALITAQKDKSELFQKTIAVIKNFK